MLENKNNPLKIEIDIPECLEDGIRNTLDKPTQQLGTTLADLLYLGTGWISHSADKWRIRRAQDLAQFKKLCEEKTERIPESCRNYDPDLNLLSMAMRDAEYCVSEETLREMFANLITSVFDQRKTRDVLPSFSRVIQQMSPLDAQNLQILYIAGGKCPIAKYALSLKEQPGELIQQENVFLYNAQFKDIGANALSLSCLDRLGLVRLDYGRHLIQEGIYDSFEHTNLYHDLQAALNAPGAVHQYEKVKIIQGICSLTEFGKAFCNVTMEPQ